MFGEQLGAWKAPTLEAFVQEQKTIAMPPKQLYFVAALADEHEDLPAEWVTLERAGNQLRQTVNAAPHIDRVPADKRLHRRR